MNHSDYIYRLIGWLRSCGVTVHEHAFDLGHYGGQYRSETREIFLNVAAAPEALITLAHETGHWLGYTMEEAPPHSYQRERQAFVYGWRVLVLIGADRLIPRAAYIAMNRQMAAEVARETLEEQQQSQEVPSWPKGTPMEAPQAEGTGALSTSD